MPELPRYWPILYILYKVGRLHDNFFLQKYIYLAKVEGRVPIRYTFTKQDYGPYTTQIKQDFIDLSKAGLIEAKFDRRWTFKLTDRGKRWVKENCDLIPPFWRAAVDKVLQDFGGLSMFGLANYIYANHVRTLEEDRQLKDEVAKDCVRLLERCSAFPSSHNALFLRGSLDYLLVAVEKGGLLDPVQRDQLFQFSRAYLEDVAQALELIGDNYSFVAGLDLKGLEENFRVIEEMCSELGILGRLDEQSPLVLPL